MMSISKTVTEVLLHWCFLDTIRLNTNFCFTFNIGVARGDEVTYIPLRVNVNFVMHCFTLLTFLKKHGPKARDGTAYS